MLCNKLWITERFQYFLIGNYVSFNCFAVDKINKNGFSDINFLSFDDFTVAPFHLGHITSTTIGFTIPPLLSHFVDERIALSIVFIL